MARSLSLVFVIAFAPALFTGCFGEPPGPASPVAFDPCAPLALVPDDGVTEDQRAGVVAATELWNARAGARLSVAPASEVGDLPALPVQFQDAAAPLHGLYDDHSGRVYINTDLRGHERAVTIAHEIGHAFGLAHVSSDRRTSVMNPGNLSNEPTAGDVDALALTWGYCR